MLYLASTYIMYTDVYVFLQESKDSCCAHKSVKFKHFIDFNYSIEMSWK